ncbi:hypothetical protein EBZ80_06795 [bacterium]|nr:hypothetical protein [bacterium]
MIVNTSNPGGSSMKVSVRTAGSRARVCLVVVAVCVAGGKLMAANPEQTRARMDRIFSALVTVLPLSLNGADYEKTSNRDLVLSKLKDLSDESQGLEAHAGANDKTFAFIAGSLSKDARDIYRWYSRGSYGESRYLLHNLTENCIACHSRLPETKGFPAAQEFFKDVKVANLPLMDRAQLQMATRQFDAALATYEELFKSAETRTSEIIMMDGFVDYLKVCIRVKQDVNRAIPVLEAMLKRPDLPKFAALQIEQWIASLKRLSMRHDKAGSELQVARKLISDAQRASEFRMDRGRLVDYIYASKLLNAFVHRKDPGSPTGGSVAQPSKAAQNDMAEAYYLLGVTESMIGRSYWLSQTEFYLETAVRTAPHSKIAEKAYALLEEQVVVEFSGSAGTNVPEDMQKTLDDLRRLMKH